jgi:hypothetical protein
MENQFEKYNYHLGDDVSEDGEDAEDEKTNSMSGSTCSSVGLVQSVCDLSIKEIEKYPGSDCSDDDDIPSLDTAEEKELTERQQRRVATANEINQMYQKLLSTGLSWDEIKKIACEDKDEAEKIRNGFNELFKEVPDIDPIKHEVRALLVLMGIFYEPKASHPDLENGVY